MKADGKPIQNIEAADPERIQRTKLEALLEQDQEFLASTGRNDAVDSAIRNYEMAYRMQSLVPDVLDLDKESKATKRLYGLETSDENQRLYSLQCLRARRLLESGVRFVEITCPVLFGQNNGTWDQHTELKRGHETNARVTDQAVAALMKDLKARGLFEETLLIWGTEFGRTPDTGTVDGDGRDHLETAFSILDGRWRHQRRNPVWHDRRDWKARGRERHHGTRPARHHPPPSGSGSQATDLPIRRTRRQPHRRPWGSDFRDLGLKELISLTGYSSNPCLSYRSRRFLIMEA